MRGRYMVYVVLIVIALGFASALAFAGGDDREKTVVELVGKRTEAMNGFYSGEISYWEAQRQLRRVECGRLLEEDINRLREYFRTDIEWVKSYEIKEVTFTQSCDDMLCAVVEIEWQLQSLSGAESYSCCYSVICQKTGDSFKLVQFF